MGAEELSPQNILFTLGKKCTKVSNTVPAKQCFFVTLHKIYHHVYKDSGILGAR